MNNSTYEQLHLYGIRSSHISEISSISNEKPSISNGKPNISMENPEFRKRCKILSFKWTLCISSRIDFLGKQRARRLIVHVPAQQKKKNVPHYLLFLYEQW